MKSNAYNDGKIKVAELLRSPAFTVRLFYVEADVLFEQHATTARELVHVLGGGLEAKMGPILEWIKALPEDDKGLYEFLPTAPQVIQVYTEDQGMRF